MAVGTQRKSAKRNLRKKPSAPQFLTDERESKLWRRFLGSKDERIAFKAFTLAKAYKSGQPPRSPVEQWTLILSISASLFNIVGGILALTHTLRPLLPVLLYELLKMVR
ncbi:MAG: hypothetical protein WBE86_07640 [Candidatus Acidiferrales bacterium]